VHHKKRMTMPAPLNVELHNLLETQRATEKLMRNLKGPPLLQAMRDSVLLVQGTARKEAKVNLGQWRASITPSVQMISANTVEGVVGSNLEHGIYADQDCRPHMPPIRPIQEWVHQKGIAGRYSVKTRSRLGGAKTQAQEDRQVAWAIALLIKRRGTKGDKALEKGVLYNAAQIMTRFNTMVVNLTTNWGSTP